MGIKMPLTLATICNFIKKLGTPILVLIRINFRIQLLIPTKWCRITKYLLLFTNMKLYMPL